MKNSEALILCSEALLKTEIVLCSDTKQHKKLIARPVQTIQTADGTALTGRYELEFVVITATSTEYNYKYLYLALDAYKSI